MERKYLTQLVHTVLESRRLLSDHVEILEEFVVFQHLNDDGEYRKMLTIGAGLLTGTTILTTGIWIWSPRPGLTSIFSCAAAGVGLTCFTLEWGTIWWKYHKISRSMKTLLGALNEYHGLLKQNITYLTDLCASPISNEQRKIDIQGACMESMIAIIAEMYNRVRAWDDGDLIVLFCPFYQPFEELDARKWFQIQELSLSKVKDLFKLFLFIQSQFVLRLLLELFVNPAASLIQMDIMTNNVKKASKQSNLKLFREIRQKLTTRLLTVPPPAAGPLDELKWSIHELCIKYLGQTSHIEDFAQKLSTASNAKDLSRLNGHLATLERRLLTTQYDLAHARLMFNRCLMPTESNKSNQLLELPLCQQDNEDDPRRTTTMLDHTSPIRIDDEFFILDGQNVEHAEQQQQQMNASDCNITSKRLQTSFRPVLQQLRKRINPLDKAMQEREKRYLNEHGVQPLSENSEERRLPYETDEDSDEELDDDFVLRRKKKHGLPKYELERELLEQKVQSTGMAMFRLPLVGTAAATAADEYIIE